MENQGSSYPSQTAYTITLPYIITGIWAQLRRLLLAVIIPIMVHIHLPSGVGVTRPIAAAVSKDSVTPHTYS